MKKNNLNLVTLGGGGGSETVLRGLKKYFSNLVALVSTADNGGSAGRLRKELGGFSVGDMRQCLIALASEDKKKLAEYMGYRFEEGSLQGHNAGNILLAGLEKTTGDFEEALRIMESVLACEGKVLPITTKPTNLVVQLKDGGIIKGESSIYESQILDERGVADIFLNPAMEISQSAKETIEKADVIVICPGNLYASILSCLLPQGVREAFQQSRAKVILVVNLINQEKQTDHMRADDYVNWVEQKIGLGRVNYAIVHKNVLPVALERLRIRAEENKSGNYKLILADVAGQLTEYSAHDALATLRSRIKHDPNKLAQEIKKIIEEK